MSFSRRRASSERAIVSPSNRWPSVAIWRRATLWKVLSQPEFFATAYASPLLGKLVALVSIAALIPYLVLQLKGLGIIMSEVSDGEDWDELERKAARKDRERGEEEEESRSKKKRR